MSALPEPPVVAVAQSTSGGFWVACAANCDRPDTHKATCVATEAVALQIADVRRGQHGTIYGGGK